LFRIRQDSFREQSVAEGRGKWLIFFHIILMAS
jgi:hypothetical protein